MTNMYFLPILESPPSGSGLSGSSEGTSLIVSGATFDQYGSSTINSQQALAIGAVSMTTTSNFSNLFSLTPNSTNDQIILGFSGGNWPFDNANISEPTSQDFLLRILYRDVAWYNGVSVTADLFTPQNTGAGGTTDVYNGGSGISINVHPLVWAVPILATTSIPADGSAHTVVINLATPLHPSQAPVAVVTSSNISGSFPTTPTIVNGSITGWTFNVSSMTALSDGEISLSLIDYGLSYWNGTAIVSSNVTYFNGPLSQTLTLQHSAPGTFNVSSLTSPPIAVVSAMGWTAAKTINGVPYVGYAGIVTFQGAVSSEHSDAFNGANLVVQSVGSNTITTLTSMTPIGSPTYSDGLYTQEYTCNVDTGAATCPLSSGTNFYIGIMASDFTGNSATGMWTETFVNRNISANLSRWQVGMSYSTAVSKSIVASSSTNTGFGPTWVTTTDGLNPVSSNSGMGNPYPIYIYDLWGQNTVNDPALEYIKSIAVLINGTQVVGPLSPVRATNITGNPLVVAITSESYNTPYLLQFTITTNSPSYTPTFTTPAISVILKLSIAQACFSSDTFVLSPTGPKPISSLTVGNEVLTISESDFKNGNQTISTHTVKEVFKHKADSIDMINLNGIKTTPTHPWASGTSFTSAELLENCITVSQFNSKISEAHAIKTSAARETEVYNLHVNDAFTYLVANNRFGPWYLVHNKTPTE